jgi:hypothetical protein
MFTPVQVWPDRALSLVAVDAQSGNPISSTGIGLSYRNVEELLAERSVEVDHVRVYRWAQRFAPLLVDPARPWVDRQGSWLRTGQIPRPVRMSTAGRSLRG